MMTLNYVEGDLFEGIKQINEPIMIAHVCNNEGGWGAGFVVPLAQHFPEAKLNYKKAFETEDEFDLLLGETQLVAIDENISVANMVAQKLGGDRPLNYQALTQCMYTVAQMVAKYDIDHIVCPMFGAGLAGGDWNFIEQLIEDIWLESEIKVTVFYLPEYLPNNWTPPSS